MNVEKQTSDQIIESVKARYGAAFAEHGATIRGLLYHSTASQIDRFQVISRLESFSGKSVLDVGCGLADLYPYLKDRHGDLTYIGLEVTPEAARAAAERFPEVEIICGAITDIPKDRVFDIVIESGIFSTAEYRWPLVESTLREMWIRCRGTMICTFLSGLSTGTANADSVYFDATDFVRLAAKLTRRFSLHHDYRDNDFTIVLRREPEDRGTDSIPPKIPESLMLRAQGH